jgi:hypothetical protein
MQDAITFTYLAQPLNQQQLAELLQLPSKPR